MSGLEGKVDFDYTAYVRAAPHYDKNNILDEVTARRIRPGMLVKVADNIYTRMQFMTLGGARGNCIIPGRAYVVEEAIGSIVKLAEGRGY